MKMCMGSDICPTRLRITCAAGARAQKECQSLTSKRIEAVASAAVAVRRVRGEALSVTSGGLRAVYRTLELPGKHPLKDAHAALDAAVLAAYGFDAKKDLLAQLLELNLAVAALEKQGKKLTAPGVPPSYGDAK